jgi:hypothetical protein
MTRAILSAALAVFLATVVSDQDKPNFVGTWKIDPSRSDEYSGRAPTETITADGSRMTITRTVVGNPEVRVYLLDGTPSKNVEGPAGQQAEVTFTSKWEGTVLVTASSYPAVTIVEKRSIQADGTMKVEAIFNFTKEHRSETGIMVFNKVKGTNR